MRALLIAEKPDLMRKVKEAYDNNGFEDKITFASFHGHLMQLFEPGDYNEEWQKWDISLLPIIPENFKYKPADVESVKRLKDLISNGGFDYLINCCDPDREGQHIFYSFYDSIGCRLPVKRMWHTDLTEKELIRALNNMENDLTTPRLKNMTAASKLRADLDWAIGMNGTRVISIKRNSLSRTGRVISAVLKILADREKAIQSFIPKTTYGVKAVFKEGYEGELFEMKNDSIEVCRFENKEDIKLNPQPKKGTIISVEKNEVKERAPQLPSLGDLQVEANKIYGYTLDKTLSLVQSLYEKKIVSYPRTDCCYVTKAIAQDFRIILKTLENHFDLDKYIKEIDLNAIKEIANDKRYVNDAKVTAHYAIIPTGYDFDEKILTQDEKTMFTLIAKRFMCIFMPALRTQKTKIITETDNYKWITYGSVISDKGYKVLFSNDKKDDATLPDLKEGQVVNVEKIEVTDHTSKPLPRFTDATLLQAMINAGNLIDDKELSAILKGDKKVKDSGGIGTPATRAAIVNKLVMPIKNKSGSYTLVNRKGKTFEVTKEGLSLANSIDGYQISSPELTAIWEQKLRQVEDGEMSPKEFEKEMRGYVIKMTEELKEGNFTEVQLNELSDLDLKCPNCGGKIKQSGKYYYCEHFSKESECRFIVKKDFNGAKITDKDIAKICEGEKTRTLKMKSPKTGNKFECSLIYSPEKKNVEFVFANNAADSKETKFVCPTCGKQILEKDGKFGKYLTCPDKCFTMSKTIASHKLTQKDISELMDGKIVGPYSDFKSKSGKNFSAKLRMNDIKGQIQFVFDK